MVQSQSVRQISFIQAVNEALRQELDLTPKLFNVIINKLTFDCIVEDKNKFVSKFGYEPVLTRQQSEIIDAYLLELKQKRYSPSIDIKIDDDILVFFLLHIRILFHNLKQIYQLLHSVEELLVH